MRPVSARFLTTIRSSHRAVVVVDVITPALVEGEEDTLLGTLPTVMGGGVTLDASASVRGRVDLTIVDDGTLGLVPSHPSDLLAPYGNELHVKRGARYADGTQELVSLGKFRIDDCSVADSDQGLMITLSGQDRAAKIIDGRFEEPYDWPEGFSVGIAINETLYDVGMVIDPDLEPNTDATSVPHLIAEEGSDRWQFVTDIARAAGMRLYFNGDGLLVLATEVSGGDPVVTLAEGIDGVLVTAGRKWDRTGAYNAVIATGENIGEILPARGVAIDNDSASPTYYYGPFGKVPRFYQSSFLATDAQAADAAAAILQQQLGTTQRVDFGTYCNPALEPDDIVRITRLRAGVDENHIVQSINIPLTADGMTTGTTRASQVT
jgi:hypothetical protein